MTAAISLVDASLQIGDIPLLHEVNLELDAGETAVVVGGAGSGKTSLLRMVLGLPGTQREDRVRIGGEVRVHGAEVFGLGSNELQEMRRSVGLVKGVGGLIENMDVRRNVALPLAYHATTMSSDQIAARCDAELAALDIAHLARSNRRPVTLNAEERAYVSLARARIVEPNLLLADDPTLGLGVAAADRLVGYLCAGRPVARLIATTWLQPFVGRADRYYLLEAGRVLPLGDANELGASDHPWVRAELAGNRLD